MSRRRGWWSRLMNAQTMAVLGALDDSGLWAYAVHWWGRSIYTDRAARARDALLLCALPASVMSAAGVDWAHIADVLESGARVDGDAGALPWA